MSDDEKDSPPPSSDAEPISLREMELEPVSLHDIERILAPGKSPPKLGEEKAKGAPRPKAPAAKAAPERKPAPEKKAAPQNEKPKAEEKEKGTAKAASDEEEEAAPDSALDDLRRLSGVALPAAATKDDKKVVDLLSMDGAKPPKVESKEVAEDKDDKKARPRPPLKKRSEPSNEVLDLKAPSSTRPPRGDRIATPASPIAAVKPTPSKEVVVAEVPPPALEEAAPPSRPKESTRPAARSVPPKAEAPKAESTKEEPRSSARFVVYAAAAAVLLGVGYMLGVRNEAPTAPLPAPTVTVVVTQQVPAEPALTPPTAAPEPTGDEPTAASAKPPALAGTLGPGPMPTTTGAPATTEATTPPTAATTAAPAAAPAAGGGAFDKSAANAALNAAVAKAAGCKKAGDPSGQAKVQVTFAPSGRVTVANVVGPPFAGTPTGGCIALAFKGASVPPFDGDPATVSKTVSIP